MPALKFFRRQRLRRRRGRGRARRSGLFQLERFGAGRADFYDLRNAACDIGFYRNLMGVPAINFGVGEKNAHSMHESIKVSDILKLSHAVTNFLAIRGKL